MKSQGQQYSIWIAAEGWAPSAWNPADDNSDVIVTFENGTRWYATFFTYQNILSLRDKNRETGECLISICGAGVRASPRPTCAARDSARAAMDTLRGANCH